MLRPDRRRRDLVLEGRSYAVVSERNASGESGAIRAVRYRILAGLGMMVLRVVVAWLIGHAVFYDLAVSADMDMRVSQHRRQYTKRQCKPREIELPTNHHKAIGSQVRTRHCGINYALACRAL